MPPNAGKGRVKGVPNKVTGDIREMIRNSLEMAGGADYLLKQSKENPASYMALVAKIVPKEILADVQASLKIISEFPDR